MTADKNYAPRTDEKREMWSMKISPRLKYLAEMAARERHCTLSSFVEQAITRALTPEAMSDDEPGIDPASAQTPLWNEGFWDDDEAARFFMKATFRHDLLTIPEQRLWTLFNMSNGERKITLQAFREFWSNPSINTSHLTEGSE
ncbi:hypothetical protein [Tunturiibacter psychrotolerans]|uniref:hypothetical protein n=1 Tax=Tunturiibacter psychrotolerans TaxID=3069686 RepID=UPI003D21849B